MPEEYSDYVPGCFPATPYPGHSGVYHPSSDLPLGRWHVMANGRIYRLDIDDVSASGEVTGVFNGSPFRGRWDGSAVVGKLKFIRNEWPTIVQQFTGYLMHFLDEDDKWRIAGVFRTLVAFEEFVEDPEDHAGWYATRPREK